MLMYCDPLFQATRLKYLAVRCVSHLPTILLGPGGSQVGGGGGGMGSDGRTNEFFDRV